jgi:hypothetical protein
MPDHEMYYVGGGDQVRGHSAISCAALGVLPTSRQPCCRGLEQREKDWLGECRQLR